MRVDVRLAEWSTVGPETQPSLAGLRLSTAAERELAAELTDARLVEVEALATGIRIRSLSHVGRIRVGQLTITIEPKLEPEALLTLVRYAYGLRDLRQFDRAAFASGSTMLADLLAAQLLGEVTELVQRGLPRRYVARAEALDAPRGRIDVGALARRASPPPRVPCVHHPRSADHELNQVLCAGLLRAASLVQDGDLRRSLRRLGGRMAAEVEAIELTHVRVMRVERALTRLESTAGPALKLIRLLLEGQELSLGDERTVALPGFLFDMNRFFQALVLRWLRDNLPECQVLDERALRGLLRYAPAANPKGRKAPRPRPDFAVRPPNGPLVLLDAKYRDLWEKELPTHMLYQLALYATSGAGDSTAAILYPAASDSAVEARVEIRDVVTDVLRGAVALRPVVISRIVELLARTDSSPARRAEAERLAFASGS